MAIHQGHRRAWTFADMALYLLGVGGLAASLTVLFLGMRAVMDVGGYCAEGGPYVIETHCPEGIALLIPLSIFAGLGSAALVGWKGSALGGGWAALVALAWPALFLSLGWNFLEYAFFPPGPDDGIVLGWLIPGVLFMLMGGLPLLALLPDWASRLVGRPDVGGTSRHDPATESETRSANELRRVRRRLLHGLVAEANERASTRGPAPEQAGHAGSDLVARLERLADLHRAGALTDDEFKRAKAAVIDSGAS